MQYFDFNKLQYYADILSSFAIFFGVVSIVWILASLYYWTTEDLRLRHIDAPKKQD